MDKVKAFERINKILIKNKKIKLNDQGQSACYPNKYGAIGCFKGLNYIYTNQDHTLEIINGRASEDLGLPIMRNKYISKAYTIQIDPDVDVSHVCNMSNFLSDAYYTREIAFPHKFDCRNVDDMFGLFCRDYHLQQIKFPDVINTYNVEDMSYMFARDYSLRSLALPENFNTLSAYDMSKLFYNDYSLTSLSLPVNFVTKHGANADQMFTSNNSLKQITLHNIGTFKHAGKNFRRVNDFLYPSWMTDEDDDSGHFIIKDSDPEAHKSAFRRMVDAIF